MDDENESSRSSGGGGSPSGGSREYKVVMLGAGGVGKSAMTMQFISHRFPDCHDPTIEDAYKTQVRIDDNPAYLDILDTAGQAEFTAMRDQYMRGGEGFIICYSITDRRSFQEAAEFKELIYRVRHTYDIPIVLVGNKTDLEEYRQCLYKSDDPSHYQYCSEIICLASVVAQPGIVMYTLMLLIQPSTTCSHGFT
ncbi:GTP-binding protein Rit2-like isoform X4 [Hypanus sabinus]|uniref:GTP-binding protein Rit2-like isoform X4 n=1 Tax=Hypanus sabinus TaxID=79690 RepID=UPI0028C44191|nr:GTP-binding protein Rit2-like isoform X4 [Hypanus sabinus]